MVLSKRGFGQCKGSNSAEVGEPPEQEPDQSSARAAKASTMDPILGSLQDFLGDCELKDLAILLTPGPEKDEVPLAAPVLSTTPSRSVSKLSSPRASRRPPGDGVREDLQQVCIKHQSKPVPLGHIKAHLLPEEKAKARSPATSPSHSPRSPASSENTGPPEKVPASNFTASFVEAGDLATKPKPETHPLLHAVEQSSLESNPPEPEKPTDKAAIAQRYNELRGSEARRGPWAKPVEKAPWTPSEEGPAPAAAREDWSPTRRKKADPGHLHLMLSLLDPSETGFVSPDTLVPIMLWLGLAKRQSAALALLQLGFGAGKISVSEIRHLSHYQEVQLRLVDGLRMEARRCSVDQFCEFLTEQGQIQPRLWFTAMKRGADGTVDIAEVQNLFLRMQVTEDRQILFRFLSFMCQHIHESKGTGETSSRARNFNFEDFVALLCRCTATWCLHKASIELCKGQGPEGSKDPQASPSHHDITCKWVELYRKIALSLVINRRFWGRDAQNVLNPGLLFPEVDELKKAPGGAVLDSSLK